MIPLMAKKPDPLSALLAASFKSEPAPASVVVPEPAPEPQAAEPAPPPPDPVSVTEAAVSAPEVEEEATKPKTPRKPRAAKVVDMTPPEFEGARKTTVSFSATEQEKIDMILDTLIRTRRHRGGFSDAIKVALRLVTEDAAQITLAWDEVRAADRRTTRHLER